MIDFDQQSMGLNIGIFAVAAVVVWAAGTKLSAYVDEYADRTGLGKAFAGALLLGGATSLPELATTLTASYSGAAELAGTNLLGGVTMQIAVLAVIDMVVMRGRPLTLFSPRSSLLMLGVTLVILIALSVAALSSGELFSVGGIGFWPTFLFIVYLGSLWTTYRYEGDPRWKPTGEIAQPPESAKDLKDANHEKYANSSNRYIVGMFSVAALLVLIGGFFVAKTGESIAGQSGFGPGLCRCNFGRLGNQFTRGQHDLFCRPIWSVQHGGGEYFGDQRDCDCVIFSSRIGLSWWTNF